MLEYQKKIKSFKVEAKHCWMFFREDIVDEVTKLLAGVIDNDDLLAIQTIWVHLSQLFHKLYPVHDKKEYSFEDRLISFRDIVDIAKTIDIIIDNWCKYIEEYESAPYYLHLTGFNLIHYLSYWYIADSFDMQLTEYINCVANSLW
jgi:hypothetical protein